MTTQVTEKHIEKAGVDVSCDSNGRFRIVVLDKSHNERAAVTMNLDGAQMLAMKIHRAINFFHGRTRKEPNWWQRGLLWVGRKLIAVASP